MRKLVILAFMICACVAQDFVDPATQAPKQMTIQQRTMEQEMKTIDSLKINYDHLNTLSFPIGNGQDFIIAVDTDHDIKGAVNIYWYESNSYVESTYKPGQEVRMVVYEDNSVILINQVFYHIQGFEFRARKGHDYIMRFYHNGGEKLGVMSMENYLTDGKASHVLSTDHIGVHEEKTMKLKNELEAYLGVIERNAVINDQISDNVKLHTKRYMWYQYLEILVLVVATFGQVRFVQKLLGDSSII